jgi:hypothetical protein
MEAVKRVLACVYGPFISSRRGMCLGGAVGGTRISSPLLKFCVPRSVPVAAHLEPVNRVDVFCADVKTYDAPMAIWRVRAYCGSMRKARHGSVRPHRPFARRSAAHGALPVKPHHRTDAISLPSRYIEPCCLLSPGRRSASVSKGEEIQGAGVPVFPHLSMCRGCSRNQVALPV